MNDESPAAFAVQLLLNREGEIVLLSLFPVNNHFIVAHIRFSTFVNYEHISFLFLFVINVHSVHNSHSALFSFVRFFKLM